MKSIRTLLLILLAAMLSGCGVQPTARAELALAGPTAPRAWIDAPLPGAVLPLAPYEFVAHGSDASGVAQLEWTLNGAALATTRAENPSEKLATFRLPWTPPGPGAYTLQVRAQNSAGGWSEFDQAVFTVGEPTPTITLTPTLTASSSPTPAAMETATPTATATPAAAQFSSAASVGQIFYGGCAPDAVELSVAVDPAPYSVVLFVRLVEPVSGAVTDWNSYAAMTPHGDGQFTATVRASSLPEAQNFDSAWLAYQFVATNAAGEVVGRSATLQDVAVAECGQAAVVATRAPLAPIVTLRPQLFPTPSATRPVIK